MIHPVMKQPSTQRNLVSADPVPPTALLSSGGTGAVHVAFRVVDLVAIFREVGILAAKALGFVELNGDVGRDACW